MLDMDIMDQHADCGVAQELLLFGCNSRNEDAKLLRSDEDHSCSHNSEAGSWLPQTQPQVILGGAKGVPCMADELEMQAVEVEEQDPSWYAGGGMDDDEALGASVTSLDSCALSRQQLPQHPPVQLQPAWPQAADAMRATAPGTAPRKPAAGSFSSPNDGWDDSSIPVCRNPVLGLRPRVTSQHQPDMPQAAAAVQPWSAPAASKQWLRPLHSIGWRGCQKGPRCDRENRHRGICNTRAAASHFVQQALISGDASSDDGEETLVPGTPVAQRGLSDADAYGQPDGDSSARLADNGGSQLACAGSATAPPPAAVPLRQSQRRLAMVPQPVHDDSNSHDSYDASSRRQSGRRRNSSGKLGSDCESSDAEDEHESRSVADFMIVHPTESQMHRRQSFVNPMKVVPSISTDLSDLVPPPAKLPRSASACSMSLAPPLGSALKPAGGKGSRRNMSARAAAAAASRPRKRASGGRGTGPLAVTQPGQHCSNCHTQVTPVWRAGPLGPKTLCNACGVRYMKTVKPRR